MLSVDDAMHFIYSYKYNTNSVEDSSACILSVVDKSIAVLPQTMLYYFIHL